MAQRFVPKNYKVARNGVEIGEFEPFDFIEGVDSGKIRQDDSFWMEGMNDWKRVSELKILEELHKLRLANTQQQESDSEAELQRMRDEVKRLRRDLELLDDPETIYCFGQMSYDGDGVEQDYVAAANWFWIAAERGLARAQHALAVMYESGQGVPQSYSEAAKWYRLAAEQEYAGSQNNLGSLYEVGQGVTQDCDAAIEWYQRAADGGDENGQSNYTRLKASRDT